MNDNDTLRVAAIFTSSAEAHIALGMLESHGILGVLNGEIVNAVLGIQLSPSDGIRLLVRECDYDEACRLLRHDDDI